MTKQQEIDSLHAYIRTLPAESYIRPWLVEIAPHVENIIRGDMPVQLCPRQAYLDAVQITKDAQATADQIIEAAQQDGHRIRACATEDASEIKKAAARAVATAEEALGKIISRL
jgi:cell division septum initiation protein DivIVA